MADRNSIHAARVSAAMRPARALPLVPPLAAILAALFVAGCTLLPVPQPQAQPAVNAGADGLAEQLAAWRANGPASYTWEVEFSCECGLNGRKEITVVHGLPTKVQTPTGEVVPLSDLAGAPLTVDAVLEAALVASKQGGPVVGSWSRSDGVPSELSIDANPNTLDDELSLRVVRLDPAP